MGEITKIGPELREFIRDKRDDELVEVTILMATDPAQVPNTEGYVSVAGIIDRTASITLLKLRGKRHQKELLAVLRNNGAADVRAYWINDAVALKSR